MAWIDPYEMGLVPVLRFRVLPVMVPLLEVARGTYMVGTQAGEFFLGLLDEDSVFPKLTGGGYGVADAFPYDGKV